MISNLHLKDPIRIKVLKKNARKRHKKNKLAKLARKAQRK